MSGLKNKMNKQPLYLELKESLINYIKTRKLKTGQKFLSENEICKKYQVSSITARRSILELTNEGILIRKQGIGTFVGNHLLYSELTIGLVIFSNESIFAQRDYYLSELIHGVDTASKSLHIKYKIFNAEENVHFVEILQKQKNLKGLIIVAPSIRNKEEIIELRQLDIPFIVVNARFPAETKIDYIDSDNKQGAYEAMKYLILQGHKNILFVNDDLENINSFDRLEGVKKACQQFGVSLSEKNILTFSENGSELVENFVYTEIKKILSRRQDITAVFFAGFLLLLGGLRGIKDLNLNIPNDVSVMSFDDFPELNLFQTPISTVFQPIAKIGKTAVQKLIKKIKKEISGGVRQTLKCELIIRDSCKKIK